MDITGEATIRSEEDSLSDDDRSLVRYQADGNEFWMYLDREDGPPVALRDVRALCDRARGMGADGVIRIVPTPDAAGEYFMDHVNADGTIPETCGNGLRCVGAFLFDRGHGSSSISIRTRAGVRSVNGRPGPGLRRRPISVEMGRPSFARRSLPMIGRPSDDYLYQALDVDHWVVRASAVSMGNPHLVMFVDEDPADLPLDRFAVAAARDGWFPHGVNVEVAKVGRDSIDVRVWERGVGETRSCGTGACAVAVAANEARLVGARAVVRFPGGDLDVERRDDGEVVFTGSAGPAAGDVAHEQLSVPQQPRDEST